MLTNTCGFAFVVSVVGLPTVAHTLVDSAASEDTVIAH
jgi:hypothetical protein